MNGYTLNRPITITCPECGGTLRRVDDGPTLKYVCHIGHALTAQAMLVAQADHIEYLITAVLAALNERRELCRQIIEAGQDDNGTLEEVQGRATKNAEMLRDFLNTSPIT
jgi:two-component system, chemotaxis family, protein-glutamate methylesterase/glutaminase